MRGEQERKYFASGFVFERLTFLSKVENRLKRGESLCENFTRQDILNFKKCLDNGNLWFFFLPFSFRWLHGHTFLNRKSNLNLIIFKTFFLGSVLARFSAETQAWVALGVNFMRNSGFCILVCYCNIVTPIF